MKSTKILLIAIIILASALRLYKLGTVPPSISWDEAAVGYNAWTIANYARDEYGKLFPAFFTSFGDNKHPIHIYVTALSVKLLGLSEFSIRLPAAIFGILNVLLIFILAKLMFSSEILGLLASFFLAVSPYNIHFSRFNHEANFALFFFLLGLTLFYKSIRQNNKFLPWSVLSLCICFITYHPAKIVVPFIGLILLVLYHKLIFKKKKTLSISFLIILAFLIFIGLNPELLGLARVDQTHLGRSDIQKTQLFKQTHNELLGQLNLTLIQYSWFFSPDYLFISGDKNPRLSDQGIGQFYKTDALLLLLGTAYLLYKRSKAGLVLLAWALIAPFPSALVAEAPHAARAMFMMGSWNLISALGVYSVFNLLKKITFRLGVLIFISVISLIFLFNYLNHYYGEYAIKNAIDWQYGMKQIVEYVRDNPQYNQIYMTNVRSQPYIFFLFYLKTPLPEYLNTVVYNRSDSKSFSTVDFYDKYFFEGWDPIESMPYPDVLYIVSSSQYDGLRHKPDFDIKRIIYYPNGTTAFFMVSAK